MFLSSGSLDQFAGVGVGLQPQGDAHLYQWSDASAPYAVDAEGTLTISPDLALDGGDDLTVEDPATGVRWDPGTFRYVFSETGIFEIAYEVDVTSTPGARVTVQGENFLVSGGTLWGTIDEFLVPASGYAWQVWSRPMVIPAGATWSGPSARVSAAWSLEYAHVIINRRV